MRKNKPGIILLSFVLQLIVLFWSDSSFYRLVDMDISYMEQRMAEDGMAPNQMQHASSVIRHSRFDISHYARNLSLQLIFLNAATLFILFADGGKAPRLNDET